MTSSEQLSDARLAIERGEWQTALLTLRAVDEPQADVLELIAQASYGAGELEASLDAWEAMYTLELRRGRPVEAARAAAMLAMFLLIDTALMAPIRAWVRKAERLVVEHPDTPPHALVAAVRTYERLFSGDLAGAREWSSRAVELGTRLGVMPAVVIGRVAAARLTIFEGDVESGLDQLDDIATLLVSGDVDALTCGMMYCELICAARGLALNDRANEWTDLMERWRHGAGFGGLNGRCRVHRAEMLRISGPSDRAEEEALLACEELRPWMRREFGWPLVELGNVRLRKGDLDGAESAFLAAHDLMWSALPGLALLRLEQGDASTAAMLVAEELAHPFQLPWKERPPLGELSTAPLRAAQAEIAAAVGDVAAAREAAEVLARIAGRFPSASLRADALLAQARAALLENDLSTAKSSATGAAALFAETGAPFEAAVARTVLAEARRLDGNDEGARIELRAARNAFEAYGASRWVHRCDSSLATMEGAPPATPSPGAAVGEFHLEGELRQVGLAGRAVTVPDMKGLRYIAQLLATPGVEVHALRLVAGEQGGAATVPGVDVGIDDDGSLGAAGLPVLDDAAKAAYRRRLADVDEEIADATAMNDPARRELAERDREFLIRELERAVGLGGRDRSTGGNAERARTAVTRSIRYALGRLADQHPLAAEHLRQRVRTGTFCAYEPDPVSPVTWTL